VLVFALEVSFSALGGCYNNNELTRYQRRTKNNLITLTIKKKTLSYITALIKAVPSLHNMWLEAVHQNLVHKQFKQQQHSTV